MLENRLKEKLCSLLDGEVSVEEALTLHERIASDSDVRDQWRRYSLISESLRSGRVLVPDRNFVERVRDELAHEPAILAPRADKRRIQSRMVTGAMAAGLALVAVFAGKSLLDNAPLQADRLVALAESARPADSSPIDPQFRDYLAAHYETANLAGAGGMLPAAYFVSQDSRR